MRLIDLHPQFIQWYCRPPTEEERCLNPQFPADWMLDIFKHVSTLSDAHGIRFDCPKSVTAGHCHATQVFFEGNPVPPRIGRNKAGETVRWKASGTVYSDLTLQPSIQEQDAACGWHGFVTNGLVTNAGA